MRDRIPLAPELPDTVGAAPDVELNRLLASHPGLENLEPFYIVWELIWFM
jgi:hypothetical protein